MTISYNTNKETGEQEYSGDILVMGKDHEGNPVVNFTIPLVDVRDDRWRAEHMLKSSNVAKGSNFIPKKQQFHF